MSETDTWQPCIPIECVSQPDETVSFWYDLHFTLCPDDALYRRRYLRHRAKIRHVPKRRNKPGRKGVRAKGR